MFSNLSESSISLATVTPSLVMRGAPKLLSSTTLRPLGPSVTLTASKYVHAAQHPLPTLSAEFNFLGSHVFTHQSVIKTTFLLYVTSNGAISAG